MYLQAGMTVKYGKATDLSAIVAAVAKGMERAGWRLDLAYRPAAGNVRQVTDLWEVTDANAVVDTLARTSGHPRHTDTMAQLSACLDGEVLQMMEPTAYAPDVGRLADVDGTLVEQRLRIVYAALPAIGELMPDVVDSVAAHGWRLVAALRPVLGDFTEVLHLWRLSDLAVFDAGRAALRDTKAGEQLVGHVVDEQLQLVERMPYSP